MSVRIESQLGVLWSVHRMPENIMSEHLQIENSLSSNIQVKLLSLVDGAGQKIVTEEKDSTKAREDILIKRRLLHYIKTALTIENKGLGLRLQQKTKMTDN